MELLIIVLLAFIYIFIQSTGVLGRFKNYYSLGFTTAKQAPEEIKAEYDEILSKYSPYYQNLNSGRKQEFKDRLYSLLHVIGFSAPEFPAVTREMRVVIACSIIEITFGLKSYLPTQFKEVIVRSRRYMYPGFNTPLLGHADFKTGRVFFSWPDVKHGYLVPDDALNVALHEMAHVIEHEHKSFGEFSPFFDQLEWNKWSQRATQKIITIRNKENKFLRDYGGQNRLEMFAVAIESFFERPNEFKKELPDIYQQLVKLLKQDPTIEGDPILGR